jgi:hypothetical protein
MKKYRMEIFEVREGSPEPVLRTRHEFRASDDTAAIAKAKEKHEGERASGVTLINFSLYDPSDRLVCEPVREDLLVPRGSRKRPVDR